MRSIRSLPTRMPRRRRLRVVGVWARARVQVKASLAAPMNTNQMKAAMEELATKTRDLEDREAELARTRNLADLREKELKSKTREAVALDGEVSHSRLEVATLKRELDKMRQKVVRLGADPGPEPAVSSRSNSRPASRVGSRTVSPGPANRLSNMGGDDPSALDLMTRRTPSTVRRNPLATPLISHTQPIRYAHTNGDKDSLAKRTPPELESRSSLFLCESLRPSCSNRRILIVD